MSRALAFSNANPRQAELLSYLQGLAPVGQPFEFNWRVVVADLGFGTKQAIYRRMASLHELGLIARQPCELFPKRQAIVVLKRLEEI
jgi:hypothetical protein